MAKLTARERRFVELFTGECAGNATASCVGAGYTKNRKSAAEIGSRLLRKVKIAAALGKLMKKREATSIATADERDQILTRIARGELTGQERMIAIKELNKCSGRHSIKHVLDVTEKISDIIAASRADS